MRLLLIGLFACFLINGYSQNKLIAIEGSIKDANGNAVPFETVRVKGSSNGTCTSSNGLFRLDGVKIGDIVAFSGESYKPAYFVVNKEYHVLNFKLIRDTLIAFAKEGNKSTHFSLGRPQFNMPVNTIEFTETTTPVQAIEERYKSGKFTYVEINPSFYSSYPKFTDSLAIDLNKLKLKWKPKKSGSVFVYFLVKREKKIEVFSVKSAFKEEINQLFKNHFENIVFVSPALQNGRIIDVLCVAKFLLTVGKDKNITLEMKDLN